MNVTPLRSTDIRERNEKVVLSLIHRRGFLSQSDAVQITGLKAPTVFRIFSELEKSAYIRPGLARKPEQDKKGRHPAYFEINPDILFVAGIDFWAGSITCVITDFSGKAVFSKTTELDRSLEADMVITEIYSLIENALKDVNVPLDKLLGIGIGAPGKVNLETGEVSYYSRIKGMVNYPLRKKIEEKFLRPVYVHNNSSVIALAELRYSFSAKKSLLSVLIRSGIGGAFIYNGKVFVNRNSTAMELGHISTSSQENKSCSCGQTGCLETVLSEDALMQDLKAFGVHNLESLEELLVKENEAVLSCIRQKAYVFAKSIRGVCELLNPEALLIITRSSRLSSLLSDSTRECLQHSASATHFKGVEVYGSVYDPILAGRGAADLVFDNFFS